MNYAHIRTGIFLKRPNRFIAHVELSPGQPPVICHVKNTGRCRELLIPGVKVVLEYHPDAAEKGQKTEYDLIAVWKGDLLINMDSQAPNQAAYEWLLEPESSASRIFPGLTNLKREVTHGDSRFDLAFSLGCKPCFMEVKGVTLEENGQARFPDAPTERGVKHLNGLVKAVKEGFGAYVLFVIQMKGVHRFSPNDHTHRAFGDALRAASAAGVTILAYDCTVTPDSMKIDAPVTVALE